MSFYYKNNGLKTPLKRARDMGSAKSGAHHWWVMKITSVALIPLTLWLFISILTMVTGNMSYYGIVYWLKNPVVTVLMAVFIAVNFWHAALGGQEIILDYVKSKWIKIPSLMTYHFFCIAAGITGIYAILYIAFKL